MCVVDQMHRVDENTEDNDLKFNMVLWIVGEPPIRGIN